MNDTSNGLVDQNTVESLKVFLQEMSATIHSLTIRHNSVCQRYKTLALSNADTYTPFAAGVSLPPHEIPVSQQWCYTDGAIMNELCNKFYLPDPPFQERDSYQAQEVMISQSDQARMSAAGTSGRCNGCSHQGLYRDQEMKSMDMNVGMDSEQLSRKWHPERKFWKLPLDDLTVQEFQSFLEEMQKTIQIWSIRHHSLVEGCQLARRNTEVVAPHLDMASTCCVELPRGNALEFSPQVQEDKAVINTVQPEKGPASSADFSQQVTEGGIEDPPYAPLSFCSGRVSPESVSAVVSGNSQKSSHDKGGALSIVEHLNSDTFHDCQSGHKCVLDHGSKSAEQHSTSCRVHRVVESPDWLPYGWITEVRTRANGSSAGMKYKSYFDPLSRRHFRSRKEVFCFLTTGNSGRYKPRPKVQSHEGKRNRDHITLGQPTTSSYQFLTGQIRPLHPSEGSIHDSGLDLSVPMLKYLQYNDVEKEAYRSYNECPAGPRTDLLHRNDAVATVDEGRLKHSVSGWHTFRERHNLADLNGADGGVANSTTFFERSWQTAQSQPLGLAVSGGMVNSQAAALQLLEKKETRNLEANASLFARFSPRHRDLYGLNLPARKLKKVKSQGKERLEALGKVICKQGLTILRGCKN